MKKYLKLQCIHTNRDINNCKYDTYSVVRLLRPENIPL